MSEPVAKLNQQKVLLQFSVVIEGGKYATNCSAITGY
jgi:hypothetical protein